MSVPNKQARTTGRAPESAGRVTADGKRVYRMVTPLLIWWAWIGIAAASLIDLLIQAHQLPPLRIMLGALTVTGAVYACTLWPRVIAGADGITVRNPFRVFSIPWGAVRGVYLAESVEIKCARRQPKKDKTVYCWALAAPRRARARAELHGRQWERGVRSKPSSYDKLPDPARDIVKQTQAEIMARELARLAQDAAGVPEEAALAPNGSGPAPGSSMPGLNGPGVLEAGSAGQESGQQSAAVVSARWAWLPIAAMIVPGVAFALSMLIA